MELVVLIILALVMVVIGYLAACCYFQGTKPWKVKASAIVPATKGRVLYLLLAVLSMAALIAVFCRFYYMDALLHHIKLLILVGMIFPMAAVDYRLQKIPNLFLLIALGFRIVLLTCEFLDDIDNAVSILKDDLLGAAVLGAFFLFLRLICRGGIGMGDIKLIMMMGFYQGLLGAFNSVFFSLMVSFFLSVGLLITKKKSRKDEIALAPSILLGTVIGIGLSGI